MTTDEEEEEFKEQFLQIRIFYHAPMRYSHNYGPKELRWERQCQTIDMAKQMFPHFTEEKILEIAYQSPFYGPEEGYDTRW